MGDVLSGGCPDGRCFTFCLMLSALLSSCVCIIYQSIAFCWVEAEEVVFCDHVRNRPPDKERYLLESLALFTPMA